MDLLVTLSLLIFTNSKFLMQYDCNIPLIQNLESTTVPDVSVDTLNKFRNYISILRCIDFSIPENISDVCIRF
jgi:hypothetical protein